MTTAALILAIIVLGWIAATIWLTLHVIKHLPAGRERNLLLAQAWGFPVFGLPISYFELRKLARVPLWRTPEKLPPGFIWELPPALPATIEMQLTGVPAFKVHEQIQLVNQLAILNWQKFDHYLQQITDADLRQLAKQAGHRAWLMYLRQALGQHYYLYEAEDAFVLAAMEPNVVMASARFVSQAKTRIQTLLGEMARFPSDTKSILLVFDDEYSYGRYHQIFNPKSDPVHQSSGMFFDIENCPHFIVKRADLLEVEPVISHELVHNAVRWLDLPLWLNEGLAVSVERRLHRHLVDFSHLGGLEYLLQEFWCEKNIQLFWSGASFRHLDEYTYLSYELAHILVENLAHGQEQAFSRFVRNAKAADAGAIAAQQYLSLDLGAVLCAVLNGKPGSAWFPRV